MRENVDKTNAMRLLDRAKIPYRVHAYTAEDGRIDGVSVAEKVGLPAERVYKTLVTAGHSRAYYVFVIPVERELDLKKAAKSVGEKSVEMIHVADINRVTGYVRGGCSPLGMKKAYVTRVDGSAEKFAAIAVSGGRIGTQVELNPDALKTLARAEYADLVQK